MTGLIMSFLAIFAAYALGKTADRYFLRMKDISGFGERLFFETALGTGILAFGVFFFGVTGLIYKGVFLAVLLVLGGAGAFKLTAEFRKYKVPKFNFLEKILLAMIALAGVLLLVLSFRPVTNFDVLSHMILLPKYYIQKHAIYDLTPFSPFFSYPQLIGMLDMLVMAVSDEVAVNHLHLLLGFLTCGILYSIGKKTATRTVGLLAALTLMTSGVFFDMAPIAKIDIGMALYAAAAFYCLLNWYQSRSESWFFLSAAICAFGFGTKYNGAFLVLYPVSFFVYDVIRNKRLGAGELRLAAVSAGIFIAVISPWLIMNFIFTHNPVSPFLPNLFNDTSQLPVMREAIKGYFERSSSGYFSYLKDVFLGMPVLLFIFLLDWKKNTAAAFAVALGAVYFLAGNFVFLHADRIFLPALVLLFFGVAQSAYGFLTHRSKALKYVFGFIYFAATIYAVYAIGNEVFRKENFPYLAGKVTKTEFLKEYVRVYPLALRANAVVPKEEKIWGLVESRGYYFGQQFFQGFSLIGQSLLKDMTPEGIISRMKEAGVRYVLYSTEKYFYDRQPALFNDQKFLDSNFDLVAHEGEFYLYKLKSQ